MVNLAIQEVNVLYQSGLSAREVGEKLGVSPWVVYKFMKRRGLPRRTKNETNRIHFEDSPLSYKLKRKLSTEEKRLKLAGIMLYWAEGSYREPGRSRRPNWTVEFTNSDPVMIRFFLRFLRKICGVQEERIRIHIYCYADQDLKVLQRFWIGATAVPFTQFTKPYVRKDTQKKYGRETKYGTVHIRYSDKRLLQQIRRWIQEYTKS